MNRRTFFGMLGAATAVVTGLVKLKPMSRMDEINREALKALEPKLKFYPFQGSYVWQSGTMEWSEIQDPDHW